MTVELNFFMRRGALPRPGQDAQRAILTERWQRSQQWRVAALANGIRGQQPQTLIMGAFLTIQLNESRAAALCETMLSDLRRESRSRRRQLRILSAAGAALFIATWFVAAGGQPQARTNQGGAVVSMAVKELPRGLKKSSKLTRVNAPVAGSKGVARRATTSFVTPAI